MGGQFDIPLERHQKVAAFGNPLWLAAQMMLVLSFLATCGALVRGQIIQIFQTNPSLNGLICFAFFIGLASCFRQAYILIQSVSWVEKFSVRSAGFYQSTPPPLLVMPLLNLRLGDADGMGVTANLVNATLDSIASRIDDACDVTRYVANVLVFLGLLGTFYGLASAVPAIVDTIKSLSPAIENGARNSNVFSQLLKGLETQLGGMGTAFSSSLLGLVGSLIIGLLELFVSRSQSHFLHKLEEWLVPLSPVALVDKDTAPVEGMARIADVMIARLERLDAEAGIRQMAFDSRMAEFNKIVSLLAHRLEHDTSASTAFATQFTRLADGQDRLFRAITGADLGPNHPDAEARMHLRSIDVQLLRLLEELSVGRQEILAELRREFAKLHYDIPPQEV